MSDKWPDAELEKKMLRDANCAIFHDGSGAFAEDTECHVKALLARVRELEAALETNSARLL
jgi:uncharacterized protein YecT (DUF1311 family)